MKLQDAKVLVTGGAGFIGSHIVESLIGRCKKVIVYDNLYSGDLENLKYIKSQKLDIVKGDILDYTKLRECMEDVDVVSHQAAELEVFTGILNMPHDLEVNAMGTLNVLKAAMDSGCKKLIYASSAGVYGQAQYTPQPETHTINPHWPYGVSKLSGEKYCSMMWNLYGFPTVSLRYAIVYGPREWYGRVLTLFIKRCLEGKPPIIFGDGEQIRDFIYISDILDAHNEAIENEEANGRVFNIGSGIGISINELATLVINSINPGIKPIWDNPLEGEESQLQPGRKRLVGELREFVLDISYARSVLHFSPKIDLPEGVANEVEWAQGNLHRWIKPRV